MNRDGIFIQCPNCNYEDVEIGDKLLGGEVLCPYCKTKIKLSFDDKNGTYIQSWKEN